MCSDGTPCALATSALGNDGPQVFLEERSRAFVEEMAVVLAAVLWTRERARDAPRAHVWTSPAVDEHCETQGGP